MLLAAAPPLLPSVVRLLLRRLAGDDGDAARRRRPGTTHHRGGRLRAVARACACGARGRAPRRSSARWRFAALLYAPAAPPRPYRLLAMLLRGAYLPPFCWSACRPPPIAALSPVAVGAVVGCGSSSPGPPTTATE